MIRQIVLKLLNLFAQKQFFLQEHKSANYEVAAILRVYFDIRKAILLSEIKKGKEYSYFLPNSI